MKLCAVLIACGLLTAVSAHADPVKIRVGWSNATASVIPIGLETRGVMVHYGQSYTVEPVHFQATPAVVTGLATGAIDIAQLAFSSLAFAIQNAKMDDLRVVADVFEDGVDDHFTSKYMVLKDSPIKTVADLKGKVLATVSAGSAMDIAMRSMLRKNGVDDRKDVSIIEAPFATMRALLAERKADLISATVGFSEDLELQKIGRTLFTQREAVGPTDMIVWTARQGFLAQNRAAMVDFLEDSLRLLRYFETPAHHDEVEALLSKFIKQPPSQFVLDFTDKDFYRNPDGLPDLKALQSNIDAQHQLGLLAQPLTVANYADLTMVKEAAARLDK